MAYDKYLITKKESGLTPLTPDPYSFLIYESPFSPVR